LTPQATYRWTGVASNETIRRTQVGTAVGQIKDARSKAEEDLCMDGRYSKGQVAHVDSLDIAEEET